MLNNKLDINVNNNFNKLRLKLLFLPFLLLLIIAFILFIKSSFSVDGYIKIQENLFFYLNGKLSQLPSLQYNLTQLGDALIIFSLVTIFIIYIPKIWGAVLTSGLISLIVSYVLKRVFAVPRPAAIFDNESFTIIGKTLKGATSLPSGHSITTFSVITILLFAFMPKKITSKITWSVFILLVGLVVVISRVGVGAHYPLDVLIGATIGYICAVLAIFINNKFNIWAWIRNKKYYPIFIVILITGGLTIVHKILKANLIIFYFSLFAIISTFYLMIKIYVKK
ncbi:phosphatase PAP2 family protein [Polaribacter cellanae]|uniref:Phosphatase PAP2 family protein n=1 Tax=Polaribacter cellanae TaxID=2818493 RepID=A0A975H6W0_9FLAO|nr:phosphatase PAP2 family protein [Polaribacter cellanae]QTE22876.1 phosphatase PAP2 family protein [Polaribacter cellanae]